MMDIDSHILYGIDDGSSTIEESLNIINSAIASGYTDLILTPHYRVRQDFVCDNAEKIRRFNILKEELLKRNMNINIHLGNEITIDEDFFYYLNTEQLLFLANSKYVLLELNFSRKSQCLDEIVDNLLKQGCIPIIAHAERYSAYQIKDFVKLIKKGVLIQGNIGSLYGQYGSNARERLVEMLERHMVHFMGSDIHKETQDTYERINDAMKKIVRITDSEEIARDLVNNNIAKIIRNEDVKAYKIVKKKVNIVELLAEMVKFD